MDIISILKIRHSCNGRSRSIRISLSSDGRVLVTRPFWVSEKFAKNFVLEKKEWLEAKFRKMQLSPVSILSKGNRSDYLHYKEKARIIAIERLEYFSQFYSFQYKRLSIRDQKTRWGSCSGSGGLNFNYRLVFLPPELQDYLVVHELCHLKEMNHSTKFWSLVAQQIPDFRKRRKALRSFQ